MFCLNLIVLVGLLRCNVLGIRNGDGAVKIERYFSVFFPFVSSKTNCHFFHKNLFSVSVHFIFFTASRRQSQSFFPREDSSANPNFSPSPSDVYFADTNAIQDQQQSHKFSNNLREDLYQQYSPHQQQPQHPQLQQQQQQQPQYELQQFNAGEYNPLTQQQYSPANNIQPQYSPQSQSYLNQAPAFGPIFSPAVTGNYPFAGPSLAGRPPSIPPHSPPPPFKKRRPGYSLYPPNSHIPYAGGAQPIYQSQHNYPVGPNGFGGESRVKNGRLAVSDSEPACSELLTLSLSR